MTTVGHTARDDGLPERIALLLSAFERAAERLGLAQEECWTSREAVRVMLTARDWLAEQRRPEDILVALKALEHWTRASGRILVWVPAAAQEERAA
jgi:hypothetical protein